MAHGLYKDAKLRDNPPETSPGPLTGRHGLRPVYSANRPETHEVYRDWRSVAERYSPPRLLLGETWTGDFAALASFYGHDDELQLGFNFPFLFAEFGAADLSGVVATTLASLPEGACPIWTASNHDAGRFPTRWCSDDSLRVRLALTLLMTLPGTTVLYYGDEIGLPEVDVPPASRRDPMTLHLDSRQNRDRSRTPMHWDSSAGGGFSAGPGEPWLPVGDPGGTSVEAQRDDATSVLAYCRDLIKLRKTEIGADLRYRQLPSPAGVWCYAVGAVIVAANFTSEEAALPEIPAGAALMSSLGEVSGRTTWRASVRPGEGIVARSAAS